MERIPLLNKTKIDYLSKIEALEAELKQTENWDTIIEIANELNHYRVKLFTSEFKISQIHKHLPMLGDEIGEGCIEGTE